MMNWINLNTESDLEKVIADSFEKTQAIFKHSTTCGTSLHVKMKLDDEDAPNDIIFHYLDLLAYRNLSNKIASHFHVDHESPQILLIRSGICFYHTSHLAIKMEKIKQQIDSNLAK